MLEFSLLPTEVRTLRFFLFAELLSDGWFGLGPANASITEGDASHWAVSLSTSSSSSVGAGTVGRVRSDASSSILLRLGSELNGGLDAEEELQLGVSAGIDREEPDEEEDGAFGEFLVLEGSSSG